MSKLLRKFIFSILVFVFLFNSVAPFAVVRAQEMQEEWYNSSYTTWFGKVYDTNISPPNEIFGERYTAAQVQWVIYGLWAFMVNAVTGPENTRVIACIMKGIGKAEFDVSGCVPPAGAYIPQQQPIAKKQSLLSAVFARRQMSGIWYVKDKIDNFSLVPKAHAQVLGFGFNALEPVREMWKIVRDVSFGLFVVVSVVFAFMIMFRMKLNPQTVITVQSAIPKLIISLVLVTFSYAIAGLLIDLMYVVIGIMSVIGSRFLIALQIGNTNLGAVAVFNFLTLGQPFGFNIQLGVLGLIAPYIFVLFPAFVIILFINIGLVGSAALGLPVFIILGIILTIILAGIALWTAVKTLWTLLKAFVKVLLLTILAPLQITLGALIPNFGFGAWFRSYVSALSTFVVVGVIMMFSYIFLYEGVAIAVAGLLQLDINQNSSTWAIIAAFLSREVRVYFGSNPINPFTGNANGWPPLLGTGSDSWVGLMFLAVSFVLFTTIPKAAEVVQAFMSGKPFAYGTALGESIAPFRTAWGATGGAILTAAQRESAERLVQVWEKRLRKGSKEVVGEKKSEGPSGSPERG